MKALKEIWESNGKGELPKTWTNPQWIKNNPTY